jgi:acetylornithine deacetylase
VPVTALRYAEVVPALKPIKPLDEVEAIALLRELMDIDSTTYHEGAAGAFLATYLESRGFAVELTPVPEPDGSSNTGGRSNVYASGAGEAAPVVVFSTHMDTVPPWIPSSENEEFVYGRGACDAKGIIVAMIAAAERLREQELPVGLLFVVGEERDSAGAKIANLNPKGSRFLINGEPTDNRLAIASKGALRASVVARGKMAHSAYPELGESAIHKLVRALDAVLQVPLPTTEGVGPSTLNIGLLEGGRAPNVIADEASAQVLVRLVGSSASTRAALIAAAAPYAEIDFTLEIPFVRLRAMQGLPTMVAAFTTDVPALTAWGEPLLLGPGSIHVAHTPDERIAKRELWEAVELYVTVAQQLAAEVDGAPDAVTGQSVPQSL